MSFGVLRLPPRFEGGSAADGGEGSDAGATSVVTWPRIRPLRFGSLALVSPPEEKYFRSEDDSPNAMEKSPRKRYNARMRLVRLSFREITTLRYHRQERHGRTKLQSRYE